jgi:hypothetical protein
LGKVLLDMLSSGEWIVCGNETMAAKMGKQRE